MEKIPDDYKVVPFKIGRFAISDADGNIIDDAQGWGYKTKVAAHKAASYKKNHGKIDSENRIVEKFFKENKSFRKDVEAALFYAVKDCVEMTVDDLKQIASDKNLELPIDAEKFFQIMNRKSCKW